MSVSHFSPMVGNKSGQSRLGKEIADYVSGLLVINKFPFNPFNKVRTIQLNSALRNVT